MKISIFHFWYKCLKCKKEMSISSSSPLEYNKEIECPNCMNKMIVGELKDEPEVKVSQK